MGTHSCGKTTLCRYISEKYELPLITETARAILSEMETPLENIRTDINLVDSFQRKVLKRQLEVERQKGDYFVSDRAFDGLAYVADHSTFLSEVLCSSSLREYANWVNGGIVFFVRPHKELLREDGVRETPTWESVVRIDGMVKLLLEAFGVSYLPVSCLSMQERVRTVDFVLSKVIHGDKNGTSTHCGG